MSRPTSPPTPAELAEAVEELRLLTRDLRRVVLGVHRQGACIVCEEVGLLASDLERLTIRMQRWCQAVPGGQHHG